MSAFDQQPDAQGPRFTGTLALFGMKAHHDHGEAGNEQITQTIDLAAQQKAN